MLSMHQKAGVLGFVGLAYMIFFAKVSAAEPPAITVAPSVSTTQTCMDGVSSIFSDMDQLYHDYKSIAGSGAQLFQEQAVGCDVKDKTCTPSAWNGVVSQHLDNHTQHPSNHKMLHREPCVLEAELRAECVQWNQSCTGNLGEAKNRFFQYDGTRQYLLNYTFFDKTSDRYSLRAPYDTPPLLEFLRQIKAWSQSDVCDTSYKEISDLSHSKFVDAYNSRENVEPNPDGIFPGPNDGSHCCNYGAIYAGNVDIYYWPEPDADTACLDVVGGEPHPIDYGASTDSRSTKYWGCIITDSTGQPWTSTTAWIATASPDVGVSFKQYLSYMTGSICGQANTTHSAASQTSMSRASMQATAYSLRLPTSGVYQNGSRPSTVVSGSFTFTSPSIYAHFTSIRASDDCRSTFIPSTMLSFTSGELSSYAGLSRVNTTTVTDSTTKWYYTDEKVVTSVFNPGDLPCPPPGIANSQFYQPHPGEPYRPQLVMPDKLRSINDWFPKLQVHAFTGFDPPHSLVLKPTMGANPNLNPGQGGPAALPGGFAGPDMAKATPIEPAKVAVDAMVSSQFPGKGKPSASEPTGMPENGKKVDSIQQPDSQQDNKQASGKDNDPADHSHIPKPDDPDGKLEPDKTTLAQPSKTVEATQPVAVPPDLASGRNTFRGSAWQSSGQQPGKSNSDNTDDQVEKGQSSGDKAKEQPQRSQQASPQAGDAANNQDNNARSKDEGVNQQDHDKSGPGASNQPSENAESQADPASNRASNGPADQASGAMEETPQGATRPDSGGKPDTQGQVAGAHDNTQASNQPASGDKKAGDRHQTSDLPVGQSSSGKGAAPHDNVVQPAKDTPSGDTASAETLVATDNQNDQDSDGQQSPVGPGQQLPASGETSGEKHSSDGISPTSEDEAADDKDGSSATFEARGTSNVAQPAVSEAGVTARPKVVTIGGYAMRPLDKGISIEGSTLTAGAKGFTKPNGDVISLGTDMLVIGSVTVMRTAVETQFSAVVRPSSGDRIITLDGYRVRVMTGGISVEGEILTPGAKGITESNGDVLSLGTDRVVIGTETIMRTDVESQESAARHASASARSNTTTTAQPSDTSSQPTTSFSFSSPSRNPTASASETSTSEADANGSNSQKMLAALMWSVAAGFLLV